MTGGGGGRGNDKSQPPAILPAPRDRPSNPNTGDPLLQPHSPPAPPTPYPPASARNALPSDFPFLARRSVSFSCFSVRYLRQTGRHRQTHTHACRKFLAARLFLCSPGPNPRPLVGCLLSNQPGTPGGTQNSYFILEGAQCWWNTRVIEAGLFLPHN